MKAMSCKLERDIMGRLYTGPRNITELVAEISYLKKVSVQGVYKALRALRRGEVVTVHNHTVSLSLVWMSKERDKLMFAQTAYKSSRYIEDLRAGVTKRARFTFHTLNEIDLFWTHAFALLAEGVGKDVYSYSIQPHDWYMYVRFDTDTFWVKRHVESNRVTRIVLTHAGGLDRAVVRERKKRLGKLFEYTLNENPLNQDMHTYLNLIGPYVFKAEFEKSIAVELDMFVRNHHSLPLSPDAQDEINGIVQKRGSCILTVERNEIKAERMRSKVKKYFEF